MEQFVQHLLQMKDAPAGFSRLAEQLKKEPDPVKQQALAQKHEDFVNGALKASLDDDVETLRPFLKDPDDVDCLIKMEHPFWGGNLLHLAASNGCQRSVFLLLEAKFDPQAKCSQYGNTALHNAKTSGNNKTVAILSGKMTEMPDKTRAQEARAGSDSD